MIPNPPGSDVDESQSSGDGDPLDQLLQEARWPEPTQAVQTRLMQSWQVDFTTRLRRDMLLRRAAVLGVAVCLCVAVGWSLRRPDDRIVSRLEHVERVDKPDEKDLATRSPINSEPPQAVRRDRRLVSRIGSRATRSKSTAAVHVPQAFSRPPNRLEEYLLAASERRQKGTVKKKPQKTLPDPAVAAVQAAVKRLVSDPKGDARVIAESLRFAPAACESRLCAVLNGSKPSERIAALRLLTEILGADAVPLLLQASRDRSLHATVVAAMARVADPDIVCDAALRETNRNLQTTLLASLLARGDAASLEDYLEFVGKETTSETALAACETVKNPPMELLFAALQSPLVSQRIAAARVIGRIDGPATTQRLIAIVERGTTRQEACLALLSSRGKEAVRYVAESQGDPLRASIFQAARFYLPQGFQPGS